MNAEFATGDIVTALAHTARTEPGDQLRIVRVFNEFHGQALVGFSYGVVNLDAGITVPFRIYERQVDAMPVYNSDGEILTDAQANSLIEFERQAGI
jgi:hypothetical protein